MIPKNKLKRYKSDICTYLEEQHILNNGKHIKLEKWQKEKIFDPVFNIKKENGLRLYDTALIGLPKKNGKALALDTSIPTPDGWKLFRDIKVGDVVFDEVGATCRVVALSDVFLNRPCYAVRFSDGCEIVSDAEHEWKTSTRRPYKKTGIWTTQEIAQDCSIDSPGSEGANHSIPVAGPLQIRERDLPIHPYVLGVWLGDGTSANASITVPPEKFQILSEIKSCGIKWHEVKNGKNKTTLTAWIGGEKGMNRGKWDRESIHKTLRELGLLGNKHIPSIYLRGSIRQRNDLLCGLMDTDGSVSKKGECEFTSTNRNLAYQTLELIRSLGLKPTLHVGTARLYGKDCGEKYRILFFAFSDKPVFRLHRKLSRQKARPNCRARSETRQIVSVEPVASVPVRCIQVDSPSRLYLAGESMIATHNSEMASGVASYMLFCDDSDAEVYSIAGDKDQARIIFKRTKKAIERNPVLRQAVTIYRDSIEVKSTGGIYQVLSADAPTAHGLNPSCVIADELWNQPSRDLWDALTLSPVRMQPLYFIVTYAGFNKKSLLYELYERGLSGTDGRMYTFWSNENLASWVNEDYLERQRMRLPPHIFARMHLNQWTSAEGSFITKEDFKKCVDLDWSPQAKGESGNRYIMAIDLGLTHDRTAACVMHRDSNSGKVVLDLMRRWIGTRQMPVQISEVESFIDECKENFYLDKILMDTWQAQSTIQKYGNLIEPCPITPSYLNRLSSNLYHLFVNGLISLYDNPELEREILTVNIKETSYGVRIDTCSGSGYHDDQVMVLGMGALEAVRQPFGSAAALMDDYIESIQSGEMEGTWMTEEF